MESDEELPDQREEYLSEFPPDDVTLHLENDLVQLGLGSDIYDETTYKELAFERDDLRQRYERERRERERLEMKFQEEYDQKVYFEGKLSGLSRNISSYEDDLQALRLENGHLKSQFEQIRSALQTSIGAGSAGLARAGSLGHRDVIGVNLIGETLSVPGNSEIYKQEVSLLAQENVLFKQIIEFIDNLEQSKAVLEERVSAHAQSNERQTLLEHDDVQRLEREKSGLEERVRDLERALGEQEKLIDEIQNKAEENLRVYKRERKVLENELHSQSSALNDYEMQISLMKQSHDTQIQAMEDRLETEITTSKEFQERNKEILRNIRKLEEERQELLLRIEEAYQAENEVVENRVCLEETYSRDMMELQRALEDEVQTKTELSVEIERLISELVESEKIRKEMEARFLQEGQKLQIPFDTERKVVSLNLNGTPINQVVRQTDSPQHTYPGSQGLPSETQMLKKEVDWKMKLTEEVRKRETLEEENKKLLYQINDLLEKNATERVIPKTSVDETINSPVGKTPYSWNAKRIKSLETEIVEIREECRILEKDAKKKKELETKNAELSEEIEDLTAKKDEAVRKQKELMRELDDSLSSVKQNEDKNRRLIEEADTLSGKIRQMENNFRNEKEDLIRTYSKNKSLEISGLLTEKEAIEQKYNEQVKTNRSLEAEIDSSKKRIHDLEKQNECLQKMQGEITNRFTKDLNYERGRSATMNDELEQRLLVFRNHTEQLEAALYENKKMYDEEVRKLEEEKQRIRNDLLTDRDTYRKRFEEEKRSMESRINEVETKLRQQNSIGSEPVATTSYFGKNESFGNGTVSQPGRSVSTETISDFKRQVDILGSMNKELQETPLNTEREHLREIDALELDNKKVKSTIEEDFRRKMDPNGKGVGVNEESIFSKGMATFSKAEVSDQRPFSDKSAPEHMEYLVRDYKEQMDDLKGQIKLQMKAFENEKQDLRRQLQEERNSTLRSKMNESSLLHITIQKCTDEVKILRQEKVNLLNRLKKEKGYNKKRETEFSEKVSKIREECERLRSEKNEAQKSVIDQRRKLAATEDRIQSMEEKHQMEIHQLEIKFENKKTKLEQTIVTTESELKEGLQREYRALLNKEREKYEDTMNDLRKEIASLQEQRQKIQTKLSSQTSRASYQFSTKKNWLNVQSFHKSPSNAYSRPFNGTKQVEDKLRDLEREVETLKREKTEINVNYRQEKIQLQAEFDQQIVGLEEKYRRQIEGLKRRLHEATMQAQSSMLVSKKVGRSRRSSIYSLNTTEPIKDQDFSDETVSGVQDIELSLLKDRMNDNEEREARSLGTKNKKTAKVRFSSNSERGRDRGRILRSLSSSMLELNSTSNLPSGSFAKSNGALSFESVENIREARKRNSFLSQAQSDLRFLGKDTKARDDQLLGRRVYVDRGSPSLSLGRQEIILPHFQSLSRGEPLSGFEALRNNEYMHPRSEQLFMPSVGIIGGLYQARRGGPAALSIGSYSPRGVGQQHHGSGFQRVVTRHDDALQGVGGKLVHHARLNSTQLKVQDNSSASHLQQAPDGIVYAGNSERSNPSRDTSDKRFHQNHLDNSSSTVLHHASVGIGGDFESRKHSEAFLADYAQDVESESKTERAITVDGSGSEEPQTNAVDINPKMMVSETHFAIERSTTSAQQNDIEGIQANHLTSEQVDEPDTEQDDHVLSSASRPPASREATDSAQA